MLRARKCFRSLTIHVGHQNEREWKRIGEDPYCRPYFWGLWDIEKSWKCCNDLKESADAVVGQRILMGLDADVAIYFHFDSWLTDRIEGITDEETVAFYFRLRNQITSEKAFSLLHIIRHASKELYFDSFEFYGDLNDSEEIAIAKCLPFNPALTADARVFDSGRQSSTRLISSCATPWINAKNDIYGSERTSTPSILQAFGQWVHADAVGIGCRNAAKTAMQFFKFIDGYEEHGRKKVKVETTSYTARKIFNAIRKDLFDRPPNLQCMVPTIILLAPPTFTHWMGPCHKYADISTKERIKRETVDRRRKEDEFEYTFYLPLFFPSDTQPLSREAIEVKIRYGMGESCLNSRICYGKDYMCEVTIRPAVRPETPAQ